MLDFAPYVIGLLVISAVVAFLLSPRRRDGEDRVLLWQLSDSTSTHLINNSRLASLQRPSSAGGILRPNDLVIVWAREFLDHDVMFSTVRDNLHANVSYLYLIDRRHLDNVRTLHKRLVADESVDDEVIDKCLNVLFIRRELTMNNYVLMGAYSGQECLYAGLIYDSRPFAWIRQSEHRAVALRRLAEHLVRCAAVLHYGEQLDHVPKNIKYLVDEARGIVEVGREWQFMDWSGEGKRICEYRPRSLRDYPLDLRKVVADVQMPKEAAKRMDEMMDLDASLLQSGLRKDFL